MIELDGNLSDAGIGGRPLRGLTKLGTGHHLQIERAVGQHGEHLFNNVRQYPLRWIADQLKMGWLSVDERSGEVLGDHQESRRIPLIDAAPAFLTLHLFDADHVAQRSLAESAGQERRADTLIFIYDQQLSVWARISTSEDHHQQERDKGRDAEPSEEHHWIAPNAAKILNSACENKTHGYSLSSLPVSLMNRLSRLGCVSVVPRTSPAVLMAAKRDGRRCEASLTERASCVSSD